MIIMDSVKKKLPMLTWLPEYTKDSFVGDLIAGTTVGLTVVPQSIAYAAIAGLPPQYGLYSAYIGSFLYAFLGPTRQVCIGPTAVMALLTYETCGNNFPECAVLTAFYSGVLEIVMAAFRLGCLVKFISEPVTVGFTNAAALTIVSSQLGSLLGLKAKRGSGFAGYCSSLIGAISTIQLGDVIIGSMTIFSLLTLKRIGKPRVSWNGKQNLLRQASWVISVSRNIICLLLASAVAYIWQFPPFKLTGQVEAGMPTLELPSFRLPPHYFEADGGHKNVTEDRSFTESVKFVGTGPLTIAVIAVLQNVAISKAFSRQVVDGSQEMLALGISNVLGGFLQAMPVSGSFSRSAVSQASGVKTPGAGLYTGIIVLLALNFLTPSFHYIPKASLAAVVICAVLQTLDYNVCRQIWNVSRTDFVVHSVTFLGCLFLGMEYGLFLGVLVNIGTLLTSTTRSSLSSHEIRLDRHGEKKILVIESTAGGRFPSAELIRSAVAKLVQEYCPEVILVDFKSWNDWDYTAACMFVTLFQELRRADRVLLFLNCNPNWKKALEDAGAEQSTFRCNDFGSHGTENFWEAIKSRRPSYVETREKEFVANVNNAMTDITLNKLPPSAV